MPRLLAPADLTNYGITLPVDDAMELQNVINSQEAYLIRMVGKHGKAGIEYADGSTDSGNIVTQVNGYANSVFLRRPCARVVSYKDLTTPGANSVNTGVTIRSNGLELVLSDGSNWPKDVQVTYTPVDDSDLRRQVLIALVRNELARTGYATMSVEGFSTTYADQRLALVSQLFGIGMA